MGMLLKECPRNSATPLPDELEAGYLCIGAVNSIFRMTALDGNAISPRISNTAVEALGLEPGKTVFAVIKVMLHYC